MSRIPTHRKLRFLLLRCSSLPLATLLMSALALLLAGYWLDWAEPGWLVFVSALLFVSLVMVVWRSGPLMWHDLRYYRRPRQVLCLHAMHHHVAWHFYQSPYRLLEQCHAVLQEQRYRIHHSRQDGMLLISAVKGRLNRLGFILIHIAVPLILLGALLDSDLWLRYQLAAGRLQAETQAVPLNDMIGRSRVGARSAMAFQGSESLHVGQIRDEVRIETAQGVLVRHLPFAVTVNAVELDTNLLLQENNFLTRIGILDPQRDKPVTAVLGSNRPFHYRGLDYYQQAISDGGSELTLSMWPLAHARATPLKFRSQVGAERRLQTRQGTINITFSDLKPRNVMAVPTNIKRTAGFKNIGPSLYYRVTSEDFRQREFINYMLPILQDGRYFFISGVRSDDEEAFRFIHLPADREGGLELFFDLYSALFDPARVDQAINKILTDAGRMDKTAQREELARTLLEQLSLFREGGFVAIDNNITGRVDRATLAQSLQLTHKLVRSLLYALYIELDHNAHNGAQQGEAEVLFFEDAMPALAAMVEVALPFYVQLQDMLYKPVVRLLVSYKPGAGLFFVGWYLLLGGLLASFACYHRRIWVLLRSDDGQTGVTVTGMGDRQGRRFAREFNGLLADLQKALHAC